MDHADYMKLALSLARSTIGQTSPNPSVGCVLVKDGQMVSTGVHVKAGGDHAEVMAIKGAGPLANGSTLYVTLEPCSHYGKTPPCTDLIIKSGVKKVFVSCLDPNPKVAGKGIETLRQAGIEVEVGLCEEEGRQINEMFFHYIQTKTPFVTLKAAVTLDGKIATKFGDSKWITSEDSRKDVHHLRHIHDGILVGINTILTDNPLLTTRRPQGGKNPIRVILDTHLKIPICAKVIQDRSAETIIFTGNEINEEKRKQIEREKVEVIKLSSRNIDVQEMLKVLGERNVMSLLVEGGSDVHASFIESKGFQKMIVYMAPVIIGGKNAYPFVGGKGFDFIKEGMKLKISDIEKIGPDLKITAVPLKEER